VRILIACLILAVTSSFAAAEETEGNEQAALHMLADLVGGGVVAKGDAAGQRIVEVTIDRNRVNQNIDMLQRLKLLNPEITQTFINLHPNIAGITIATTLAVMAVITEYRTQKTDKCSFVATFLVADDYGQKQRIPLFSFAFDRALYNRINWDDFSDANISKVSKGYRMSAWAAAHLLD
jgi:hypothetical protein